MWSLQLPDSWGEAYSRFCEFGIGRTFQTPSEDWQKEPESLIRLFATARSAVEHMMETFPIVKSKDVKAYSSYRTKETILEIYDAMAEATRTGQQYKARLDPPPGDPKVAHTRST